MDVYLAHFSCSTYKATAPACLAALDTCEGVSHTSAFPDFHGMIEHLSGRFPLVQYSPVGSSQEGVLAEVRALWMMLFTAACQGCLPSLHRQLRPLVARSLTFDPQWLHSWGRQRGVSSLNPTAMRVISSSIRNPRDDTGKAFSHAPDSLQATRRWAWDLRSGASESRAKETDFTLGESHSLWQWDKELGGGWLSRPTVECFFSGNKWGLL